jgi:hypothetical protein
MYNKETRRRTVDKLYLMFLAQTLLIIAAPVVAYKIGVLRGKKSQTASL